MDKIQEISGWGAAGLTICSFIFPVFPYLNVIRGKLNYEDTPSFFVITSYVNYFCMYVYGDMVFSDQVKYCYIIGSCVNCLLMVIYLIYEIRRYLVDSILNALIIITGTWALYRCLTIMIDDDRTVGKICILTFFIVFITPIQILYRVLKERNYNLIPIYNCWLSLCFSICWVVYAVYLSDFYILFPYIIFIIISLAEIVVYINLSRKYPAIGQREFSSTIGIETSGNEEIKKEETPVKMDEEMDVKAKEKPVKIITKN
jgi:hypothetical protein